MSDVTIPLCRPPHCPDLQAMEAELLQVAANINAAQCRWLDLLSAFEQRGGWMVDGVQSMAHWLSWRCGITPGVAREKVRVAKAIQELPKIHDAFERGELSYSKVRAMTRIATVNNEAHLVTLSKYSTAMQLASAISRFSSHTAACDSAFDPNGDANGDASENSAYEARDLTWYFDTPDTMVLRARLTRDQGEVVLAALRSVVDSIDNAPMINRVKTFDSLDVENNPEDKLPGQDNSYIDTIGQRRADALERMADICLSSNKNEVASITGGDRYMVTVDVCADELMNRFPHKACQDTGLSHDDPRIALNGIASENASYQDVAAATLRRIGCDASFVANVKDKQGNTLSIGRKTRSIPPAIRRALRLRDAACTFPSCQHRHYVDAHHIRHWADGGETKLDNLILLCRRHHRLVHEGGYSVELRDDGVVEFSTADGRAYTGITPTLVTVETLVAFNARNNMIPDPQATDSLWSGESMDYSQVVGDLMMLE